MKFSARWLIAVSSSFLTVSALAAEFTPQSPSELQQALISAAGSPDDDRIILDPGITYLTEGQPFAYTGVYSGNLTIESASPDTRAVLDGGSLTQVLVLSEANGESDTTFSLRNVVVSNGVGNAESRNAAGLLVSGAHTVIEGSEFRSNTGAGGYSAAAIYADGGREYELTLTDSVVRDNDASPTSHSTVIYGYQLTQLHITGGTVVLDNNGDRGVLKLDDSPTIIDGGSRFEGNLSRYGGNIYPDSLSSPVQISHAEFINNSITENSGAGVLSYGAYQIDNSLFRGNYAPFWSVVRLGGTEDVHITSSRFVQNQSDHAGVIQLNADGAVLSNLLFDSNQGNSSTEGIVSCARGCQVLNSLFAGNTGAPLVFANYYEFDQTVVANSVVLGASGPVLGFDDSYVKASLLNNYLAPAALNSVPLAQVYQNGNITDGSDPGIDVTNDYALLDGSALIDKGTTDTSRVSLATLDIRGNSRVAGESVDIGWEEFGSSDTVPVIANFELLTTGASNMDLLQFRVEYEAEGIDNPLVEFYSDETGKFQVITPELGIFEEVLFEAGPQIVTVRVTGTADQFVEQDLTVKLNELSTSDVIARVDQDIRALCAETPEQCGIDTDAIREEGYNSGVAWAEQTCLSSPESCGIDISPDDFDESLIPSMGEGWELFGTGQPITDMQSVFGQEVRVIWTRIDGQWQAWSAHRDTAQVLRDNQIAEIQSIPAHAGFWVRK